jgi:tRNA pseudouridine55 synthase
MFVLVDKPAGVTSHDVVNMMRRKTGIKRIGHAGTLDPLATGLLIILIGRESTKQQSDFLHMDKCYECEAILGLETDSYDIDGQTVSQKTWSEISHITQEDIEKLLPNFIGQIQQTVPAFSAVKRQGKKLYQLARQGKMADVVLPVRQVEVFEFELVSFKKDVQAEQLTAQFTVHCSSGTYIRSLIHDLGKKLSCGATVKSLRRTKIGNYSVQDAEKIS